MGNITDWAERIFKSAKKDTDKVLGHAKEYVDDAIDYIDHRVDVVTTSAREDAYDVLEGLQGSIHKRQSRIAGDINVPLAYREYSNFLMCKAMKDYLPSIEDNNATAKKITIDAINIAMPEYEGNFTEEQILPSDKMPFVQSPCMLSYWAKSKGCNIIKGDDKNISDDCMILTYYTPLAKSFLQNTSNSIYDDNSKHFYSHCKSEVTTENGKIVINPELKYNSPSHTDLGEVSRVVAPSGDISFDTSGYKPEDAIVYEIDYQALGLSKKDVETSALYLNADINILDPKIQNSIFRLDDVGYTPNEIIELYRQNIDLKCGENIDALVASKDCNLDNLKKADNSYRYNLTDYNCAVKPLAPLIFANECKIRSLGLDNEQANQARVDLGLPNIYDRERYASINNVFYRDFETYIINNFEKQLKKDGLYDDYKRAENISKLPSDLIYSIAVQYGVDGARWLGLEVADRTIENMQNHLKPGQRNSALNYPYEINDEQAPDDVSARLEQDNTENRTELSKTLYTQTGELYYNPLSFSQNMRFDFNLSKREDVSENEDYKSEDFVPYPLRIDNNNER